jgi:hypothetical protein
MKVLLVHDAGIMFTDTLEVGRAAGCTKLEVFMTVHIYCRVL